MIVLIGNVALYACLVTSLFQFAVPWLPRLRDVSCREHVIRTAAVCAFVWSLISFAVLIFAHATSHFEVVNVAQNSHSAKPLIYKISGVWGNREGSMVLLLFILTLFGMMVALRADVDGNSLRYYALSFQGAISTIFHLFTIILSNPFKAMEVVPIEGRDLNPILQNIGLAVHPPLLYLGYVGFSMSYSFAIAGLTAKRIDRVWAQETKRWALTAWCFLTAGITLGSYWAYYELGWGGFWFWDPTENVSIMPWLSGTALLHALCVLELRGAMQRWSVLLSIITFTFSLLGTFLVRSGAVTSVHAFAINPGVGVATLLILVVLSGGGAIIAVSRRFLLVDDFRHDILSRESAILINNIFLVTFSVIVLLATLMPLIIELVISSSSSVASEFYRTALYPLGLVLLLVMPIGRRTRWIRDRPVALGMRIVWPFALSLFSSVTIVLLLGGGPVLACAGVGVGMFAIYAAVHEMVMRLLAVVSKREQRPRLMSPLKQSMWGSVVVHLGIGFALLGISFQAWSVDATASLQPGKTVSVAGYDLTVSDVRDVLRSNYVAKVLSLSVQREGEQLGVFTTERRRFMAQNVSTSEVGLFRIGLSQIYVVMASVSPSGAAFELRVEYKSFILLIWFGGMVSALGGFVCLFESAGRSLNEVASTSEMRSPIGGGVSSGGNS